MRAAYPSIFNDVIGPVMRGPSSSHCAASLRIGRVARDLMGGKIDEFLIEFDAKGSLATTHESQGTDMGLFGGILGWEAHDERLVGAAQALQDAGIKAEIKIVDLGADHPNTYKLYFKNDAEVHHLLALSTGGGMIEITEIDGFSVSLAGDTFATLVFVDAKAEEILQFIKKNISADDIQLSRKTDTGLIVVKAQQFINDVVSDALNLKPEVIAVKQLSPVLPVLSRKGLTVPFLSCRAMQEAGAGDKLDLWELAVRYESARGGISGDEVFEKMAHIVRITGESIGRGIQGTEYKDRILGHQSGLFKTRMQADQLLDGGMLNRMILNITAIMEVKSAMGVIVAAPTAGSCGTLAGVCHAAADFLGLSEEEKTKAMLAAGMIGIFIAAHSTFAAEVCGCQAECGAASGMAAAALVTLAEGSLQQAVSAASMALQNIFGMVCDPVANRVEVPCLGKNILAAGNALSAANMALAGFDAVVPLDQVIDAMDAVGRRIPAELRCTALGGLSVTRASMEIEKKLNK